MEITRIMITLVLLVLVSGCKTVNSSTDKQESYSREQDYFTSVGENSVGENFDKRTITQWFSEWYSMQHQQHSSEDKEQIQETITTTSDSTGTVTRIEQRITNRSKASEFTQNARLGGQEYKYTVDSLSRRVAALELKFLKEFSLSENESKIKQDQKETVSNFRLPFWAALLIVAGFVAGLCLFLRRISLR